MAGCKGIRRGGPGAASEEEGTSSLALVSGLDVIGVEAQGRGDSNSSLSVCVSCQKLVGALHSQSGCAQTSSPTTPELRSLSCFLREL